MNQEKKNEWAEHPVTIFVKERTELEIKLIQDTPITEYLCISQPQKTQENMVAASARVRVLTELVDVLTGDMEIFDDRD